MRTVATALNDNPSIGFREEKLVFVAALLEHSDQASAIIQQCITGPINYIDQYSELVQQDVVSDIIKRYYTDKKQHLLNSPTVAELQERLTAVITVSTQASITFIPPQEKAQLKALQSAVTSRDWTAANQSARYIFPNIQGTNGLSLALAQAARLPLTDPRTAKSSHSDHPLR